MLGERLVVFPREAVGERLHSWETFCFGYLGWVLGSAMKFGEVIELETGRRHYGMRGEMMR